MMERNLSYNLPEATENILISALSDLVTVNDLSCFFPKILYIFNYKRILSLAFFFLTFD